MPNYLLTMSVRDSKNKVKSATAHGTFADDATASTRATALYGALSALILGQLAKVELTKVLYSNAAIPVGNVDAEVLGVFTFRHAQGYNTQISIPTFDEATYVEDTSDNILIADADVLAFTSEIISGGWTDYRWSDIIQLVEAKKDYGG